MNRVETRRRWEGLIAEQAASGLSIAEFCRRKELSPASFYQWRKKLAPTVLVPEPFVSVAVREAVGVSVELPCGAVVRVPPDDERALAQVLALLLAVPGEVA